MIRFYLYLFVALAIILCLGMSTFWLIIGFGLLGAVGNGIVAAKRQADEDKKRQEKEYEESNRALRELLDDFNYRR